MKLGILTVHSIACLFMPMNRQVIILTSFLTEYVDSVSDVLTSDAGTAGGLRLVACGFSLRIQRKHITLDHFQVIYGSNCPSMIMSPDTHWRHCSQ